MMNENNPPVALPDIDEAMLIIKQMQDKLDEYQNQLEREVKQRTEHLLKQIKLLEACNANLCDKFEVAQKEILVLRERVAQIAWQVNAGQGSSIIQLYGADNQSQQPAGLSSSRKITGHVSPS